MANDTPEFKYLFRFRDLVADTIGEHKKIIASHGSCWWGWWKRPSEDGRMDVWEDLKACASASEPTIVGLFDSGSGRVYPARVSDVILPSDDPHLANSSGNIPEAERNLVPAYYRESPFSRAWMKLVEIGKPVDVFGAYSYSEPPTLPNYSGSVLSRLVGKVILSKDELTGMDTTIWKVRRSKAADPRDKIILGSPGLSTAIAPDAVRCRSDVVLHITDLHFAVGTHSRQHSWRLEGDTSSRRSTMAEAISQALDGRSVGLILVTGDLTFLGSEDEFIEAQRSLVRLLGQFDLGPDHLVIIPGNHDIQWTATGAYEPNAVVKAAPSQAFLNYETFYRSMFRHDPDAHLAMGRRYLLPSGIAVEICGLNSSSLETGKDFLAGMGRIEENGFVKVAGQLDWKSISRSMALRILAIHHHIALTEDLEPAEGYLQGYGLAVDAVRVQRMAANFGVQLAIHGHKHRAFIWRSSVYGLPESTAPKYKLGEISIIGGGSAGSTDTDGNKNYFNTLEVTPAGLHLTIYQSDAGGAFEKMQCWNGELAIDPELKRLALRDWKQPGNPHQC